MSDLADQVRRGLGLPPSLGLCVATFDDEAPADLSLKAWPSLAQAVPARQREFLWGRRSARLALAAVSGDPEAPLPVMSDRRPAWPEGWIGSISHAAGVASAIACRERDHPWIGQDVEALTALDHIDEIAPLVATPAERSRLSATEDLLALFSAKEALFKALRPGRFLDFEAAELIGLDDASLTLRLTLDWSARWPAAAEVQVRRFRTDRWIFTAALPV